MALITIPEAAARLNAPVETIQDWVRSGLLTMRQDHAPRTNGTASEQTFLEEEELAEVAESMGWLHLSSNWDYEFETQPCP